MNFKILACSVGLLFASAAQAQPQTKPVQVPFKLAFDATAADLAVSFLSAFACDSPNPYIMESYCRIEFTTRDGKVTKPVALTNAVEIARKAGIPTAVRENGVRHFKLLNVDCHMTDICTADAVVGKDLEEELTNFDQSTVDRTSDSKQITFRGVIPGQLYSVLTEHVKLAKAVDIPGCYLCTTTYHVKTPAISCDSVVNPRCQVTNDKGEAVAIEGEDAQSIVRFLTGEHAIRLLKPDNSHVLSIKNVECISTDSNGRYPDCVFEIN